MRRHLKGAYTIWLRDVIRFARDRVRMVAALGQPLLYLFVFGSGLDFRQFMFPGILAMAVLFTAIFSAVSIVWDRELGFLKEVMVAPVSRTAVALGKVAGGATVAMFQGLIILLLAPVVGVKIAAGQIAILIGLMLLLATVMTSLGIVIAARQRTMEGFQMMMNFLMMPMFFLSGAFFPLRGVPVWLSWLSNVDPVTYGVDALRQETLRRSVPSGFLATLAVHPIGTDILVMAALSVAFVIPAVWQFGRRD